jgi:hypothetical protein
MNAGKKRCCCSPDLPGKALGALILRASVRHAAVDETDEVYDTRQVCFGETERREQLFVNHQPNPISASCRRRLSSRMTCTWDP